MGRERSTRRRLSRPAPIARARSSRPSSSSFATLAGEASLAVFSHRNQGAPFAVHLLRGLAAGLYGLTAFFAIVAALLERLGTARAFGAAVAVALLTQLAVLRLVAGPRASARIGRGRPSPHPPGAPEAGSE